MADDNNKPVNNSNKPINGRSKIERIQVRREDALGEYTERQAELEAAIEREESKFRDLEAQYAKTSDKASRVAINAKLVAQAERYTQAEERYSQYESSHAQKVNAQAAQEIATYAKYENINARTTTMSGSQRYFSQIQQDIRQGGELIQTPTEAIEQRIRSNQQQAARLGRELAGQTRGLGYDEWTDEMRNKDRRLQQLQEDTALDKRLIKVQIKEGMTTEKRQYAAKEVMGRAGRLLGEKELAEDVREGRYGDLQSETERLSKLFEKLSQAAEKFESASQNATDAQGNLTEEYKQASKALDGLQKATDKQRQVVSEIERQGGGDRAGRITRGLVGFNRAIHTAYGIDIEDEMSEMRLKSAMGRRAVDQYQRRNAAIGGDMGALLRETAGQDFITQFSDKMRDREMRRSGLTITAGAEAQIGTLIDSGLSGGLRGIGKGVKTLGGGAAVAAADVARRGTQLARGIPQTRTALEGAMAAEDFVQTMLAIPSDSLQAFYNNYMLQSESTMGIGAGAANIQWRMTNTSNLRTMAELGVSPGKSAQLLQQGIRQIGTTQDIPAMIQMAGRVEQSRLMSSQEFMGMQGQLSNVGAGTFDLENIMKNAVAAGMDNAKNIQQMADATTAMAGDLAKSGVSGTGAAGNLLGVGIQRLRALGVDQNIATAAAQFANESQKKFSQDISMDLGTVHETNRIRAIAPGIDTTYQMRVASLNQTQLQGIISGGREAADKFGLGSIYDQIGKQGFKDFAKADLESSFYKADGHIMMTAKERKEFFGAVQSGNMEDVPDKFRALYSTITGGADFRAVATAGEVAKQSNLPDAQMGALEKQKIMDAEKEVQKIRQGQGKTSADNKMDKLITVMQVMLEKLDPTAAQGRAERAARDMDETPGIVQAGDKFNKGTEQFAKAVSQFDSLVKRVDLNKQTTGGIKLTPQGDSGQSKAGAK